MANIENLQRIIARNLDTDKFREQHWAGTFWDYLGMVAENPQVTRNAFQRLYDMVLSYGTEEVLQYKEN